MCPAESGHCYDILRRRTSSGHDQGPSPEFYGAALPALPLRGMRKLALRRRSSSVSGLGAPDGGEPAGASFGWASNAGGDKPRKPLLTALYSD